MLNIFSLLQLKTARIGIVGMGYVGLPLALRYAEVGFNVLGIDIDPEKVEKLKRRISYLEHIPSDRLRRAFGSALAEGQASCPSRFDATMDFALASSCDAIIICVPTPLDKYREPDLSFVTQTVDNLLPHLRQGQVVSLESTTYPGTTEEELLPRIQSTGLKVGQDVYLVYSPEREDPGNKSFHTATIPKVCGGVTPMCLEVGVALYSAAVEKVVPVSSTRAAELTKLLENIHRAVNIGLVNEMKRVADLMKIDIFEVIDAASTKPFGFTPYYPGPGLGGHCIPVDPFYLTWKAREYGIATKFIELAGEVNSEMPSYVVSKVVLALNSVSLAVNGSKILLLGIAYKKNVDDMRESPSLVLLQKLKELGAEVSYSDPHIPTLKAAALNPHGQAVVSDSTAHEKFFESVPLSAQTLESVDCVLIATDHDAFDYELVLEHAKLIVDTRGRYRKGKVIQKVVTA